jgi:hypothetical protein
MVAMRKIVTALLPLFFLQSVYADVVFTNFGLSDTFDNNTGLTVADSSGTDLKTSLSFTPVGSFQLTQIDFVTSLLDGGDQNQVTLTLSAADANGNPGASIEVFSFSGQMGVLGSASYPPLVLNAVSAINPVLQDGTVYWLTAESSPDVTVVWNQNILSPNDVGNMAQFQSSAWATQSVTRGAFRVLGNPVTVSPAQSAAPSAAPSVVRVRTPPVPSSSHLLIVSRRETK